MFWLLGGTLFLELFSVSDIFFFLNQQLKISKMTVVYTHEW